MNYFKHFAQLLVEIGSIGTIQFEEERKTIPEDRLPDIEGRYLKLRFKNPNPIIQRGAQKFITPDDSKLLAQDVHESEALIFDDNLQMQQ